MLENTKIRIVVLPLSALLLCVLMADAAIAQKSLRPKLDLESAVTRAMENDSRLRASRTLSAIADEQIHEARSGLLPTVKLNQTFARSNNPGFVFGSLLEQGRFTDSNFSLNSLNKPNGLNNFRSSVSVRAPILDQRQSRSQVQRAKIEKSKADLEVSAVSQQLRFDVLKTFFAALLADELLKATDASVRSARENSRKTEVFVNVGMVPESDSLVANVELANVEQQKLEAQGAVVTTRAALNIVLGEGPTMMYDLVGNLQERYFPVEDESELVRIALTQRANHKQALLALEKTRQTTNSIRDQRLPRLEAFAEFGYSSPYIANGSFDYTVGLSLSYTLFDPGRKTRLEQAILSESVASAEKDRLTDQITLEVITADQNYRTAMAKIRVSIRSVIQAEEALRILHDRYRSAISTFDTVLRAEAALLRARHELLKAKYQYYVSYASVLLATGRLVDVGAFIN